MLPGRLSHLLKFLPYKVFFCLSPSTPTLWFAVACWVVGDKGKKKNHLLKHNAASLEYFSELTAIQLTSIKIKFSNLSRSCEINYLFLFLSNLEFLTNLVTANKVRNQDSGLWFNGNHSSLVTNYLVVLSLI